MEQIDVLLGIAIILVGIVVCIEMGRGIWFYCKIRKERKVQVGNNIYFETVRQESAGFRDVQQQLQHMIKEAETQGGYCDLEDDLNKRENEREKQTLPLSMLEDYRLHAEKMSVKYETHVETGVELPCNELDTVSLLGNLLDNAMEACETTKNPCISVTIQFFRETKGVLLVVENSKDIHSRPLEKGFATSKSNAFEHGKGIPIIKGIVEKYHGNISWRDSGDYFITTVEFGEERDHV